MWSFDGRGVENEHKDKHFSVFVSIYQNIKQGLFDKNGELLGYLDIYVNGKSAYPEELAKPVKDGDELDILFMIVGG